MLYEIEECYIETSASAEDIKRAVRELIYEQGCWCVADLREQLKEQGYYVSDRYAFDEDAEHSAYPIINYE